MPRSDTGFLRWDGHRRRADAAQTRNRSSETQRFRPGLRSTHLIPRQAAPPLWSQTGTLECCSVLRSEHHGAMAERRRVSLAESFRLSNRATWDEFTPDLITPWFAIVFGGFWYWITGVPVPYAERAHDTVSEVEKRHEERHQDE